MQPNQELLAYAQVASVLRVSPHGRACVCTSSPAREPARVRRWFRMSDARVSEVSEEEVLGSQAFMLFYERAA